MEISKIIWRAALSSTEFGKRSAVYGHIDENGASVRNWPARKMAITDKSPENAGLSVKCVLLTDKPSKMCSLSVNLNEILAESVEQYCCLKKVVFIHWELKVPDKVSRKSTVFVRLFVKFKTEKRLSPSLFLVVKSPK